MSLIVRFTILSLESNTTLGNVYRRIYRTLIPFNLEGHNFLTGKASIIFEFGTMHKILNLLAIRQKGESENGC